MHGFSRLALAWGKQRTNQQAVRSSRKERGKPICGESERDTSGTSSAWEREAKSKPAGDVGGIFMWERKGEEGAYGAGQRGGPAGDLARQTTEEKSLGVGHAASEKREGKRPGA